MDHPDSTQITHDFPPFFRVYGDGRVERFVVYDLTPPATDLLTGVEFKDVLVSSETGVKARISIPKIDGPDRKLPLVVQYHGGAFCRGSAFSSMNRQFLISLSSKAQVIVVSIDYRLAPEHPLPIAYYDSWIGLQWIANHSNGQGPESWLNRFADFGQVFFAGESAGANIAHHIAVRVGCSRLEGFGLRGVIVIHPFFADSKPSKMIQYLYPGSSGSDDDPKLSPKADPDLAKMGGSKVLVFVAEKDWLKPRGVDYYDTLKNSSWKGSVEMVENEGEDHCFHLFNPNSEKVGPMMQKMVTFITQD